MKMTLGNHFAVVAPLAERDRIQGFYRDVLGWTITRQSDQKDDFRFGDNFYIAFVYDNQGAALDDTGFRKAMYLELQTDNIHELRQNIVAAGVAVLDVPDPHLYFQAPGGQVWRLVEIDEELSKYEGNDDLRDSVDFVRKQQ
jgi:catechol 2,3-dioxygenase-like lactoylglutathione lyase family enzyme